MPEGDTVHRCAAELHRALAGHEIVRADLRVPRHATADLRGRRIEEVLARGKHLLHRIGPGPDADDPLVLHTTLGMDGSWRLVRPGGPWGAAAHRVRAVLETGTVVAVGVALPRVELAPRRREAAILPELGPDLLGDDWDEEIAAANLARRPERQLAAALLDQRNLAGIGNEYAVEMCFLLGVRPTAPVRLAGNPLELVRLARRLLLANRDRIARTTTGDARPGRRSWVHRREGLGCRRCGTRIREGRHDAGAACARLQRRSWYCPRCQPEPGERATR